jgi:hypothetical protein
MARHPADIGNDARIATAIGFAVHFRKSPFVTFNEPADTLEAAHAIKARMDAEHGQHGRRAMIYAITKEGVSVPVTASSGSAKSQVPQA